jgi:hypothetical protein
VARRENLKDINDSLDNIVEALKNDNYYHSIIKDTKDNYILFFDIDSKKELDINDFIDKMKSYINSNYEFDLESDDFSYTQNNHSLFKFHVVVPFICASIDDQRNLNKAFIKKYPEYGKIYDSTVYCSNRFFRLPNQSKGLNEKNVREKGIHIIKRGNMEDFVLDNIGDNNLMDNVSNLKESDSDSDDDSDHDSDPESDNDSEDDIEILLEDFPFDKFYTDRRSWLYFLGILKSAGLNWSVACKYAQRMGNHDPCTCERTFKSLTKEYTNPTQKIKNIINRFKKLEYVKIGSFDFKDTYDILDFKEEFNNAKFESYKEIKDELGVKIKSVIAYIIDLECFIIKSNGNLKILKRVTNCMPKIYKKSGEKFVMFNVQKYVIESIYLNYNSMDYVLSKYENDRIFNIWKGYDAVMVDKPDQEVIDVALDLLLNVYCAGDKEMLRYILTWFSNIVSTSGINKIALVLIGTKQGGGKGTFLEFMEKILGKHCYKAISGIGQVTQKHNTCVEGRRLIVMNEAASTREEFRSNFDKLKSIITDPTIEIEPKGLASYEAKNLGNYIIVSNHEDSVVIESSDRRYQVLNCSDIYINNTEYFGRVRKILQLDSPAKDAANSFYTYLMNYKDKVDLFKIIDTELRQEMKNRSLPSSVRFIKEHQEFLDRLELDIGTENLYEVRAVDLYKKYENWAKDYNEKVLTNTKFGTDIKDYITKISKKDGIYYRFNKKAK